MGGPQRGRLQVPQVRGRSPDVGPEEEEQQHDLREAEPRHEVLLQARHLGACGRPETRVQVWEECERLEAERDGVRHVTALRTLSVNFMTLTSYEQEGVDRNCKPLFMALVGFMNRILYFAYCFIIANIIVECECLL